MFAVPPGHHNRVCSHRALHFLVPRRSSQIIREASMPTQSGSYMYVCRWPDTYVIFLCNIAIPPDERPATSRQPPTNFECSWRPSFPRDIHQMSVFRDLLSSSIFRSRLNTFALIMVMPSFTQCALAYPLIVPYRGRPVFGLERSHRLCLNYIVPNSLVAHIPRADDVVSSQHFFPLATKRTHIDTPFKDRAI